MSQSTDHDHLEYGQLGTADVTASTVANIGPGIDFYFGFGVIAATAGVAAPLTILAAALAVALLASTVAEFTRAEPSAGSFTTYVDTALGARAGVATALLVQVAIMLAVCFLVLVDQRAVLSGIPFPGHTSPAAWPAFPRVSRWPCSCSSDGRTAPRSPRSPAIRAAPFRGPCTSRRRSRPPGAAVLAWIAGIASVLATLAFGAAAAVTGWLYVDRHPRAGAGEGAEA